jgi:hypothetical protein
MTAIATPPRKRDHNHVLGTWVASVTAMMPLWKKTRNPVQRPRPVTMLLPSDVSRVSCSIRL